MGYKIDIENRSFNFTQPFMVQSFKGGFERPTCVSITLRDTGTIIVKAEDDVKVS